MTVLVPIALGILILIGGPPLSAQERGAWFHAVKGAGANSGVLPSPQPVKLVKRKDGSEMTRIPAGEFWMGNDRTAPTRAIEDCQRAGQKSCKDDYQHDQPQRRVYLDAFLIDRFEVTNAQFDRFVKSTGYQTDAEREGDSAWVWREKNGKWVWVEVQGANWRNPNGPDTKSFANHAAVQISWQDAEAYCKWSGKRLLTEAEWEKAARGTDARQYPWGEGWSAEKANGAMTIKTTVAIGSYPLGVSPYGVYDLAGNAAEWVADWYDGNYYASAPKRNPKGPHRGKYRVIRGGSWLSEPRGLRTFNRARSYHWSRHANFGFRCGR
jgi:iron(II)-dependent oxidoreductase